MSYLEKIDRYLKSLKVGKSPLVDSWFMMSSPIYVTSIVATYLILLWVIPKVMKNRPPLRINKLITYYNAAQVVYSIVICYKVLSLGLFEDGIMVAGCRYSHNSQNLQLLDVGWHYYIAKITELLDTVFFVLRKKNSQVTFLHVYHHVVMAFYSWAYLKFASAGDGAILTLLNSAIHVVMYSYYLLAGLGPKLQKYLWWKKYVTTMQLVQFIMMLSYCFITSFKPQCQFNTGYTYFISTNITIFLFLFLNFYSKSYKRSKSAEKEILDEFEKSRNGVKKNGVCNGATDDKKTHCQDNCIFNNAEEIPFQVNKICGDYIKDGKVFLTRRTAKAAYGAQYDFDSIKTK